MSERTPAYQRLDVDERRRRLLELGAELFTRHTYAELSMAAIAREAGHLQGAAVPLLPEQAGLLRRDAAAAGRGARRG